MTKSFTLADRPRLLAAIAAIGLTQKEISNLTKLSQGQVSRIISGNGTRASKGFQKICVYVFSRVQASTTPASKVKKTKTIVEAIDAVWDGTEDHAHALSVVIRALGALHPHAPGRLP